MILGLERCFEHSKQALYYSVFRLSLSTQGATPLPGAKSKSDARETAFRERRAALNERSIDLGIIQA